MSKDSAQPAKGQDSSSRSRRRKTMPPVLRAAEELRAEGRQVIPLPHAQKKSPPKGWRELKLTEDGLREHFAVPRPWNLAVGLGRLSGWLVDVDLDCEEAIEVAEILLPATKRIFGRPGAERSHYQFVSEGAKSRDYRALDGSSIVQLLSTGRYVVMPESIHEGTRERIAWASGPGLQSRKAAEVDPGLLQHRVALIAVTVLLSRHWPAEGSRHDASLAAAGMLLRAGVSVQDAKTVIMLAADLAGDEEAGERDRDVETTRSKLDNEEVIVATTRLAELIGEAPVRIMQKWLGSDSDTDQEPHEPPPGLAGKFRRQLQKMGVNLRYDEFHHRVAIDGLSRAGPWLDDRGLIDMQMAMEPVTGKLTPKNQLRDRCIHEAGRHAYHPVRDLLAECEQEWDGTARIDEWMIRWLGAEDTDYVRAVGAITLIAAVRRVRQPGCKFDEMLVLEGEQGTGKSTLLQRMAMIDEWFLDDLQLSASSKELIEQTAGKWIVEIGELSGLRKAEVQRVKSMLSRQVDTACLKWATLASDHPRQFIAIGTTNDSHYLRDQTGNRRFWPVTTSRFRLPSPKSVRQLWGEAAVRETNGESIRLPKRLWKVAQAIQESRTVQDPIAERLRSLLGDLTNVRIRSDDVYEAVGCADQSRRTPDVGRRVAEAMQRMDWQRKQVRSGDARIYHYVQGAGERVGRPVPNNAGRVVRFEFLTPKQKRKRG